MVLISKNLESLEKLWEEKKSPNTATGFILLNMSYYLSSSQALQCFLISPTTLFKISVSSLSTPPHTHTNTNLLAIVFVHSHALPKMHPFLT